MTRKLDWSSRHDPESRNYPIRALLPKSGQVFRKFKTWTVGPCLDQDQEGACVGHGYTNEATASPVRVDFAKANLGAGWPKDPQAFAFALYEWCKRHDSYPGTDYDGTAVLTGAQGMQKLGFIPEYRWAFGTNDVIDTLCAQGPVVLGIEWREDMYDAPGGELTGTGRPVGGHCILACGYDPARKFSDGTTTEAVLLFNSWGRGWGINGLAWIKVSELAELLKDGGEMCVPVHRSYGRTPRKVCQLVAAIKGRLRLR